jgi:hypothetical protein
MPRLLYPRERPAVLIVQEAGWAVGPVWVGVANLALPGYAIPAPITNIIL